MHHATEPLGTGSARPSSTSSSPSPAMVASTPSARYLARFGLPSRSADHARRGTALRSRTCWSARRRRPTASAASAGAVPARVAPQPRAAWPSTAVRRRSPAGAGVQPSHRRSAAAPGAPVARADDHEARSAAQAAHPGAHVHRMDRRPTRLVEADLVAHCGAAWKASSCTRSPSPMWPRPGRSACPCCTAANTASSKRCSGRAACSRSRSGGSTRTTAASSLTMS